MTGRGRGLAAALAMLLLGAACTSGDDGPPAAASTTTGAAQAGGTVRLGLAGSVVVDPVEASLASPSDLMVLDLLHDGLTRLDAEGAPQPALATEWEANEDFTAFRFTLDPAATFTSGRPVVADDVIASLERVLAVGESSLAALSLEAVTGFDAFAAGETDHLEGLSAPDEQTVRIALDTPLSVLPEVLSDPVLSVVDPETVAEADDLGALDLTGAWAVEAADGDGVRVARRDGRPGSLDAVELAVFADSDAAYQAFEDGDVDWALVPAPRFAEAVADHGDGAFAPFHAELFFGMNVGSPTLSQAPLRQAILAAIDREAIVAEVYPDLADPLSGVVPAGLAGSGDPVECDACSYDPDAASALVAEAFPDGEVPVVHVDFDRSPSQTAMAERIATDLDAVGIPTELRPKSLSSFKQFVVSGDQELFTFGWIGAYGSPDAYLSPLFGSAANDNLTGFRSAKVDGYLARARAAVDPDKNAQRWDLAERAVLDAAVVVPIAQFRTQVVVADRVEGLRHAVDGTVDWAAVAITG